VVEARLNKIHIKLTYKDQIINIVLPEELADKYTERQLGAVIISTWNAMKFNANRPIPLPSTQEAIDELRNGGGKKFDTFDAMMKDVDKED
jgi:ribosomal protein S10